MSAPAAAAAAAIPTDPTTEAYHSLENFTKLHRSQFTSMGLPEHLYPVVHQKLYNDIFDVTEMCELEYVDDPDGDSGYEVLTKRACKARDDVWILDHAWTTNYEIAKQTLRDTEGLLDRLWSMCDMNHRMKKIEWAKQKKEGVERKTAIPDILPVSIDESQVTLLMEQASVDDKHAREVLIQAKGDLINAMQILQGEGPSDEEKRMQHAMEQSLNSQTEYRDEETPLRLSETVLPYYTTEQKIDLLYDVLFDQGYLGSYFTMKAREDGSTRPVKPDEIETVLYLHDEIGSGIRTDPANYNARLEPLVVVTLNGVSFSLLWFIKDVEENDEIIAKSRPLVPKTPVIQPTTVTTTSVAKE